MKTLFILLSLIQVPLLILYVDYYERFVGDVTWIGYNHYLILLYIGFAIMLGIVGSHIPRRWFWIVCLITVLTQIGLMSILTDTEHNWYFKPFGILRTLFLSASFYIIIQSFIRFIWVKFKKEMQL
ncbi:hypothetical protein GCM10008935_06890 [Alkalibacillus silvisoli]|uniref:Uncharacterized protein n=1 Tax=Alkalibacillus silvisoli TaxID=392823 RepID=A0ABP3JKT4_9BACI